MSIGAFSAAITVSDLIGELECSIKALNDLLQPAVFRRDRIIIGKADDLDQVEIHVLKYELLLCKPVCIVSISGEFKSQAGELFKLGKGHSHSKDAWAHVAGVGYLITQDRLLKGIHDKPNIVTDTFDLGVGFIGSQIVSGLVVVVINERLHKGSGGLCVISNRDVRNLDSMHLQERSGSDSGRKAQVDIVCKAKPHDVGGEIPESQIGSTFGQRR